MRDGLHRPAATARVPGTARWRGVLPLLAVMVLAGGCGDGKDAGGGAPAAPPAADASPPDAGAEAAPQPAPAAAAPLSPDDSIRQAREDSTQLARDYYQRLGARESLTSCLAKAKQADPPQRALLEAACKRSQAPSP